VDLLLILDYPLPCTGLATISVTAWHCHNYTEYKDGLKLDLGSTGTNSEELPAINMCPHLFFLAMLHNGNWLQWKLISQDRTTWGLNLTEGQYGCLGTDFSVLLSAVSSEGLLLSHFIPNLISVLMNNDTDVIKWLILLFCMQEFPDWFTAWRLALMTEVFLIFLISSRQMVIS